MKITNFKELFEAFKLIYDIGIQEDDKLEMFSENLFCFHNDVCFDYVVSFCKTTCVYSVQIGEKNIKSKDPKRIYDLAKAIIKCED